MIRQEGLGVHEEIAIIREREKLELQQTQLILLWFVADAPKKKLF